MRSGLPFVRSKKKENRSQRNDRVTNPRMGRLPDRTGDRLEQFLTDRWDRPLHLDPPLSHFALPRYFIVERHPLKSSKFEFWNNCKHVRKPHSTPASKAIRRSLPKN